MSKALELLSKLELEAPAKETLSALLTSAQQDARVASKALLDCLDAIRANDEQTEQIYALLEESGIEIDVSDVLPLITSPDLVNPTVAQMEQIESEEPDDYDWVN
ncbi:MAG: hypothetical protein IIY04_02820, partial [Oscillospiraceae bacterium]|nr:hypothetical protein [Oscillospiraceae bacterium]